jgi:hypothetical protein
MSWHFKIPLESYILIWKSKKSESVSEPSDCILDEQDSIPDRVFEIVFIQHNKSPAIKLVPRPSSNWTQDVQAAVHLFYYYAFYTPR